MEKSAEPIAAPEKRQKESPINRILRIAAYPIAGISGLFVMGNDLHRSAYEKSKGIPGNPHFKDIQSKFDGQYAEIARDFEAGVLNTAQRLEKELVVKKQYSAAVGEKMEKLGFSDKWFRMKDITNKWETVNRGSKQQAVINGLTVAGIAVGALLATTNSQLLDDLGAKDKENSR